MISTELMNCAVLYTATTKADKQLFRRSSRNNQQHNQATEEVSGDRDSNFLTTQHVQQPKEVCKKKKKKERKKKKRSWSPPSQSPQQTAKAERPLWQNSCSRVRDRRHPQHHGRDLTLVGCGGWVAAGVRVLAGGGL